GSWPSQLPFAPSTASRMRWMISLARSSASSGSSSNMTSYSFNPNAPSHGLNRSHLLDAASGRRRDGRDEKRRQCSIGRMKRLLALVAGGLGLRALLRRRSRPPASASPSPAEDLRAKLAHAKAQDTTQAREPEV